jgi:hypothetical protein
VQQRIGGVIPNFYSTYDWNAPPMEANTQDGNTLIYAITSIPRTNDSKVGRVCSRIGVRYLGKLFTLPNRWRDRAEFQRF